MAVGRRRRRIAASIRAILPFRLHQHAGLVRAHPERRTDTPLLGDLDDARRTFRAAVDARPLHLLGRGTELMDDEVFVHLLGERRRGQAQDDEQRKQHRAAEPNQRTPIHRTLR